MDYQRLNHLIELISSQEAKLNRLKALRKLAKEQAAANLELSNELKLVNNSISEKDGELRQALNRVDNLNRQLNNYRRTRTYRNSKNVAANKQATKNSEKNSEETIENSTNSQLNQTEQSSNGHVLFESANQDVPDRSSTTNSPPLSLASGPIAIASKLNNNNCTGSETFSVRDLNVISDQEDPIKKDTTAQDASSKANSNQAVANRLVSVPSSTTVLLQNHPSQAINKYANTRQKLKNSANNGRRVSFDPLALLLDAALEGELDLVIQTSKQVPDLSASHDECVTALHNAVVAGHYEITKYLINAGCDINVQDIDGWTPLHCAANCNNLPLVKLLIENGALIYATTYGDQLTPAMKCNEEDEGFDDCYKYLMFVQNNLGVINNGVVYALYEYEAQREDELSFSTGEELVVLRRDDSQEQEWWWAQKRIQQPSDTVVDIREGYIPRNLLGLYPRARAFKKSLKANPSHSDGNDFSE